MFIENKSAMIHLKASVVHSRTLSLTGTYSNPILEDAKMEETNSQKKHSAPQYSSL